MKSRLFGILLFISFVINIFGADIYVSTSGNDTTGNGSEGNPYRTVQKGVDVAVAGDTVLVSSGNYDEYVITKAHGTGTSSYVKIKSITQYGARVKQFRVQHRTQWIEGFQMAKPSNINLAHVRIEQNSHNVVVTNNFIGPGAYIISTNASFGTDHVYAPDVNFTDAGFVAGSLVFWGSSGFGNLWYTNHDTAHTVASISGDGHTMYITDTIVPDSRSNFWAFIYAGQGNNAYDGISLILGSGISCPTNITLANNIISNTVGAGLRGVGDVSLITGNIFKNIPSYYGMVWNGRNSTIVSNLWKDNTNVLWYTPEEIDSLVHPEGGDWFDYQVGHLGGFNTDSATNNTFIYNWVQGVENQLGILSYYSGVNNGYIIKSNVFVGVGAQWSISRNDVNIQNNTFYRCSYDLEYSTALALGGISGNTQTGLIVKSNVFVDIGYHGNPNNEGFFTVVDSASPDIGYNFVTAAETMGWGTRTVSTPSWMIVNGGDPIFRDVRNPLGPDGLPFTDDDGLRPLLNSPLAKYGLGALASIPVEIAKPIPHFSQVSVTSWKDNITTNYNSVWATNTPWARNGPLRPYYTPEALGHIPLTVEFSATNSISGLVGVTNHYGIRYYKWDFGDGATALTTLPNVCHTYLTTGTVVVTLWATNFAGYSQVCSNAYRLLDKTNSMNIYNVATSGNDTTGNGSISTPWRTLQKAANTVVAGDYVAVHPGSYGENVDFTVNATSAGRITFVSLGATNGSFNMRKSFYTIEGFGVDFQNIGGANGAIYIYPTTTNIIVRNNFIGPSTSSTRMGIYFAQGTDGFPDTSQQYHSISNNFFYRVDHVQINGYGRGHKFIGNLFIEGNGQCDLFRVWGADHTISDNFAYRISYLVENHSDFYQIFGPDGTSDYIVATNIVLERNTVLDSLMQIGQFETFDNPSGYVTNIVFRNNIWNVNSGCNIDMDGFEFYNNLFYRCTTNTGHVFAFGGIKGSAYGTKIKNNMFIECGTNPSNTGQGWYARMENQSIFNYSLEADYNIVIGSNGASKDAAPPSSSTRWGSSGGDPSNTWEANGINGGNIAFVNATIGDFRLQTNSVALNRGLTISSFGTDNRGITRPQGSAWDIGPLEYSDFTGRTKVSAVGNVILYGNIFINTQ